MQDAPAQHWAELFTHDATLCPLMHAVGACTSDEDATFVCSNLASWLTVDPDLLQCFTICRLHENKSVHPERE